MAFTQKLSKEGLAFFNNIAQKTFSEQAIAFLNSYWNEVGDQAEFIFSCAFEVMKACDMHTQGISLRHLYNEGHDVDFNVGLYFYEQLCKKVFETPEGAKWRNDPRFKPSMPEMMTAIVRKQELREKVDVNFDGRVSFLEYLLYQYRAFCNPYDFIERQMKTDSLGDHPEITKARLALEEVNAAIRAYEQEKARLQAEAQQPGVRGLGAKHSLHMLAASPLAEKLNAALIKAEAAVRMATRKYGPNGTEVAPAGSGAPSKPTNGMLWWMNRDLAEKQSLYGRRASRFQ